MASDSERDYDNDKNIDELLLKKLYSQLEDNHNWKYNSNVDIQWLINIINIIFDSPIDIDLVISLTSTRCCFYCFDIV